MGLDITVYRRLTPIDATVDLDEYGAPVRYEDYMRVQNAPEFAGREAPLKDGGWYAYGKFDAFRAGSYSGYNEWRDWLAKLAGYPAFVGPDSSGSRHGHRYAAGAWAATGGPFKELIDFSDCEGVIGSEIAAKLAADFDAFAGRAAAAVNGHSYYDSLYERFRGAFHMAADAGCVVFC